MLPTPHRAPIPDGAPRAVRIAVAAALAAALAATGAFLPTPASAATPRPGVIPPSGVIPPTPDKLGSHDADLLAQAKTRRARNVTMMIATTPGRTAQVVQELSAVRGASVGRRYDTLGYVRATVPTTEADDAIAAAEKLSSVQAIDLRDTVALKDPQQPLKPQVLRKARTATTADPDPGPGKDTPADNPYNPTRETGAVDFVAHHPTYDGRGVTIGILDGGVDLASPALQKTTTGERKIVDWVSATDPLIDGDGTWLPMTTTVTGPSFTYDGKTWKAPAGSYRMSVFHESVTATGNAADGDSDGDVNRNGTTTDSWGVLYDPAAGTVTVDLDGDGDFTDDTPMKPYKDGHQIGHFGTDDPATPIAESQDFVVQISKDVPMDPRGGDWVGKKADFVDIGLVSGGHGTHMAGIAAANGMFGGRMNGAAPGAKIVSERACVYVGGANCTNVGQTEGMIDLVVNRGVDIVNMSIAGTPSLNDGSSVLARLYTRLIDTYGVQIVIAAANSGPGANTIGDPSDADEVISVGASISRETYAANYGRTALHDNQLFNFSSRGPREDGGFTPTVVAPGAAVSTFPAWMPGSMDADPGWKVPPGYAMWNGTSMASPQVTGAGALLLSAAKQHGIKVTPAQLRTALTSTGRHIEGAQAYEEGAGLVDVPAAWQVVEADGTAHDYTVKAPVRTSLDQFLRTPGFGTGVYDREGGLTAGQKRTYDVTVTRTSGPSGAVPHALRLTKNEEDTFSVVGPQVVDLPLNEPVTVQVQAAPRSAGIKSAILQLDDPLTPGVDKQIMTTVVVSTPLAYTFSTTGPAQTPRNTYTSYFVTVPKGTKSLEVTLGGLKDGSTDRMRAVNPYGVRATAGAVTTPGTTPYLDPLPGVWEIEVDAGATAAVAADPYTLTVSAFSTAFSPDPVTLPEARVGTPSDASWTLTNCMEAVDGHLTGGPLGSSRTARPTITQDAVQRTTIDVPDGTTSLAVAIGNVSDTAANLDLTLLDPQGDAVAFSGDSGSDEAVSLTNPVPGKYTVEVNGFVVPSGSTAYDYRDVFYSTSLGRLTTDESVPYKLGTGDSAKASASVTVAKGAPEGRDLFGEVRLANSRGTITGVGRVTVGKVTG